MILPLEKQVSNLKLSKELKKLGVRQDSFFYWYERYGYPRVLSGITHDESALQEKGWSAFTIAELGEVLKWCGKNPKKDCVTAIIKTTEGFKVGVYKIIENRGYEAYYWQNVIEEKAIWEILVTNEADARAELVIYRIKNKLCKNPKLGARKIKL